MKAPGCGNKGKTYHRDSRRHWAESPRPPWLTQRWWLAQLADLPQRFCGKIPDHGEATAYYTPFSMGQMLGYRCPVCGWDKPVLVQEAFLDPCAPAEPLPPTKTKSEKVADYRARRKALGLRTRWDTPKKSPWDRIPDDL